MYQLYSITRTDFYKNLKKNKVWKLERTKYTFQNIVYAYGCDITNGHKKITIEPQINESKRRTFIFKFQDLEHPENNISEVGVDMNYVKLTANRIIYA